jgi:pimeloyl-ACP methyl ester carboxylesterase
VPTGAAGKERGVSRLAWIPEAGHQARKFLRPLPNSGAHAPLPPPLPNGRVVYIPGRGETFVREAPGSGSGPTVVLLHGWTLSADLNWFSGGYEVASRHGPMVAPDLRGHGRGLRSEEPFTLEAAAEDVAGLLVELQAGPSVIVGYSMGSSIALLLAHMHPELVSGLVLASVGLQWRASVRERLLWFGMAGVEYVLRFGAPQGITDRYLREAVQQSPALGPYRSWLKAEARRGDASDIANAGKALGNFDARGIVRGICVPTAVVVTNRDHLIRAEKQRTLADAIPGAVCVEVDGAHNAWMVNPVGWCDALGEALNLVTGALDGQRVWGREPSHDEAVPPPRGVPAAELVS